MKGRNLHVHIDGGGTANGMPAAALLGQVSVSMMLMGLQRRYH